MVQALREAGTLNISTPEEHRKQLVRISFIGTVGGMAIMLFASNLFPYLNDLDLGSMMRGSAKHVSFVKPD
jgi:hypothetical protein